MRYLVSFVCFFSALVFVTSAPFFPPAGSFSASTSLQLGGTSGSSSNAGGANALTNILSNIDLPGLLRGVNSFVKLVGAFCPPLSQVLDNVIQNVTSTAFRVIGSAILRNGGLGGGGGGGGQKVSVVLPTFPPGEDDDEDDEDETEEPSDSNPSSNFNADLLSRTLNEGETITRDSEKLEPLVLNRNDESSDSAIVFPDTENSVSNTNSPTTAASSDSKDEDTNPTTLYTSPVNEESNLVAKRHVRVTREAEDDDQEGAESAIQPSDDITNVDDQDRNKRFLPFGGGAEGHASGGSGNFLFDIIRNTADRAARTVGTVYRMVAGTESLGWGLHATSESTRTVSGVPSAPSAPSVKLVAGSGATEETDEKANAPGGVAEIDIQKSHDGLTEGIPGPITRLFVIANRSIANLVQDLILRLAATSEKLVNFKARLITSLI